MGEIILKPKEDRRIRAGHLWVFSNEIDKTGDIENSGDIADIFNAKGRFIGRGYYNRHTLIASRILTFRLEEIDRDFMGAKIRQALEYRDRTLSNTHSCRLVYSEGDLLPGLIVDRFEDYLVTQILTLGMNRLRDMLIEILNEIFWPKGILLRTDSAYAELEGITPETAIASGDVPDSTVIEENGARFLVDIAGGQKTGFFFDQRDTRAIARKCASGKKVLDCFCYSGGFAVNCGLGGAKSVLAVDNSENALNLLNENVRLNSLENTITSRKGDCFEVLRSLPSEGEKFDFIILDPPAFVKRKSRLSNAIKGYREINIAAMKLLTPGGLLLTCSCSQNLESEIFLSTLRTAARDSGRQFRLRQFITQAPDHPILHAMPETRYLKCFLLEAIR